MSKFFFEGEIPEYYPRQLNALLALADNEELEIPADELTCVSEIASILQKVGFGLSESTLVRVAEIADKIASGNVSEETRENCDAFLRNVLAVTALQDLASDKHDVWDSPEYVLAKIAETAAEIEANATNLCENPTVAETHAEKVVSAAMTAKALGPVNMGGIIEGTPGWAMDCADNIRTRLFAMIITDSFEELEDVLESFEPTVTSLLLSHVLLTNDFLARSDNAKSRIGQLVNQLEKAVAAGTREGLDGCNAEAEAFIELAAIREALSMAAESMKGPEQATAHQVMQDIDLLFAEGAEEEMRRAIERANPIIETLVTLTMSSNVEDALKHVDEGLLAALCSWKHDLRSSIATGDADALATKRRRYERLLEGLVSFDVLCTVLDTFGNERDSGADMDMALNRLRTAIVSGDVASADKRAQESYVLLNGSLYLRALDAIMSSEDEAGLVALYKAHLVGHYVDLEIAVRIADYDGIERAIEDIGRTFGSNMPYKKAGDEENAENTQDPINEEKGDGESLMTALECVAAVTSTELKLRRRKEEIERKSNALMAFLETEEGKQALMETAMTHVLVGDNRVDFVDSISEKLGLGKMSEW